MKNIILFIVLTFFASAACAQPEELSANADSKGTAFKMYFEPGEEHNYPSFVVWLQDTEGNFIQTLFVTESVGTGIYPYKPAGDLKWEKGPGEAKRPAALPYWFHKRGGRDFEGAQLPTPQKPVVDAFTGATPRGEFILNLKANNELTGKVRLYVEVNQPWDVNEFWTNNKHPENNNYLTSCQPALIYAVTIDLVSPMETYYLNPVGHSHPYGKDGRLYTNLTTFTTALEIFDVIKVQVMQ